MSDNIAIQEQINRLLDSNHFSEKTREKILALGEEAEVVVRKYASGSYPEGKSHFQSRAIMMLGLSEKAVHVPVLEKLLKHPNEDIRLRSIMALGQNKTEEALEAIESMVGKFSDLEVEQALEYLKEIDSDKIKSILNKIKDMDLPAHLKDGLSDLLGKFDLGNLGKLIP